MLFHASQPYTQRLSTRFRRQPVLDETPGILEIARGLNISDYQWGVYDRVKAGLHSLMKDETKAPVILTRAPVSGVAVPRVLICIYFNSRARTLIPQQYMGDTIMCAESIQGIFPSAEDKLYYVRGPKNPRNSADNGAIVATPHALSLLPQELCENIMTFHKGEFPPLSQNIDPPPLCLPVAPVEEVATVSSGSLLSSASKAGKFTFPDGISVFEADQSYTETLSRKFARTAVHDEWDSLMPVFQALKLPPTNYGVEARISNARSDLLTRVGSLPVFHFVNASRSNFGSSRTLLSAYFSKELYDIIPVENRGGDITGNMFTAALKQRDPSLESKIFRLRSSKNHPGVDDGAVVATPYAISLLSNRAKSDLLSYHLWPT